MLKILDMYSKYETDGCTDDGKCGACIPESFYSLCGEAVRDHMRESGNGKMEKMCDCIILDGDEKRVTLAELKSGEPKASVVRHAKYQLTEGMVVLGEMLLQANRTETNLQLVLFSKQFRNHSATVELETPIEITGTKMRVIRADCHSPLPESYVDVKQSALPRI